MMIPSVAVRAVALVALSVSLLWLLGSVARSHSLTPTDLALAQQPREYGLAVSGADQNFIPGRDPDRPPVGRKWVMVAAVLNNVAGPTVVVTPGSLTLIDQNGQRYSPAPPGQYTRPPLVGATRARGEWLRGLVLFEVPQEAIGEWLEWCPPGPGACQTPLRSPIPLTPTGG